MKQDYLLPLQSLRALAFLAIYLYHCSLLPLGPWGVTVFFVLSGFVLMIAHQNDDMEVSCKSCLAFAFKHIKKIYMLHVLMTIIVVVREWIESGTVTISPVRLLTDLFLVSSCFPPTSGIHFYNGVAWFLTSILLAYLLFPYFLNKVRHYDVRKNCMCILLVWLLQLTVLTVLLRCNLNEEVSMWLTYFNPLFRIGDFLTGINLFLIYQQKRDKSYSSKCGQLSVVLLILSCCIDVLYLRPHEIDAFRKTLLYAPSVLLFIYYLANIGKNAKSWFTNKILVYIGNMSGLYFLIHQVVIYNTKWWLVGQGEWGGVKNKIIVAIAAFPITLFFAYLYKRIINYFFKNKRNNKLYTKQ